MKFSIVIPCKDRLESLRKAVKSCLEQTCHDFELIIIDDCSSSDIASICASYSDARIRCFRNAVNLGVSKSRNVGIANARGEYVLFLDSDDEYLHEKLAHVDGVIAAHPEAAVYFHAQNRLLPSGNIRVAPARAPQPGERLDDFILLNGNHVQTNSYVIRADIAQIVRFDENCNLFEDTRFIIECSFAAGGYRYIPEVLSIYDDSNTNARLSKLIDERAMATFFEFVLTRCSTAAAAGFFALMCGYISLWRHPVRVLSGLWRGHLNGVGTVRTVIYLLRSAIGARTVNRIVALIQK